MRSVARLLQALCAVGLLLAASSVAAQDLKMVGMANVSYTETTARLQVGGVENRRTGGSSGTLSLLLFFNQCATPDCPGFDGARFRLGELTAGQGFTNIDSGTIAFTPPPPGTYTMHLVLTEFPNDRTAQDSVTFTEPQVFRSPSGGTSGGTTGGTTGGSTGGTTGGTTGGGTPTLTMSSPSSFNQSGGSVNMQVASVCNTTSTMTDNLSIRLWYTTQPDAVGSGFSAATANLGRLPANSCFNNINSDVAFEPPPPGTYYVHFLLLLAPDDGANAKARAIIDFPDTFTVKSSSNDDDLPSVLTGGGAVEPFLLLSLLGMFAWRSRKR